MKGKLNFKLLALLVSVMLVMGTAVDGTLAFLFTKSESVTNTFEPGHVGCVVSEPVNNNGKYEYTLSPDNKTNTSVYIRAAVVANWADSEGNVHWQNPAVTVSGTGWTKYGEYWYYQPEVAPGGSATALTVTLDNDEATPSNDYSLQIQVLGEAIQTQPGGDVVTWDNGGMNSLNQGG